MTLINDKVEILKSTQLQYFHIIFQIQISKHFPLFDWKYFESLFINFVLLRFFFSIFKNLYCSDLLK